MYKPNMQRFPNTVVKPPGRRASMLIGTAIQFFWTPGLEKGKKKVLLDQKETRYMCERMHKTKKEREKNRRKHD